MSAGDDAVITVTTLKIAWSFALPTLIALRKKAMGQQLTHFFSSLFFLLSFLNAPILEMLVTSFLADPSYLGAFDVGKKAF